MEHRRLTETDEQYLKSFHDGLWKVLEETKGDVDRLTPTQRRAFLVTNLMVEINNGGVGQFYENSSGDYASETLGMLRAIGANKEADVLEEAEALFGESGPNTDRKARWMELEAMGEAGQKLLDDDLTMSFYAAMDENPVDLVGLMDLHLLELRDKNA